MTRSAFQIESTGESRSCAASRPPLLDRHRVLFFIGTGRTGSTLLGAVLNLHPQCLIANEARVLTRFVRDEAPLDALLADAADQAWKHFLTGIENDPHFGRTLSHHQPRWRPLNQLAGVPELRKSQIRVIGDKKAGGGQQSVSRSAGPRCSDDHFARRDSSSASHPGSD